jgi:hypothetical protein
MKALRPLLLAALCEMAGCTTAGRILGLAVAEDTTRIAGALTNQEKTASELADKFAVARHALEAQEQQVSTFGRAVDELKSQPSPVLTGGAAMLASLVADYLQGLRRDNRHNDRDRALEDRLEARRRRRRDDFDDGEDEDPPRRAVRRRRSA